MQVYCQLRLFQNGQWKKAALGSQSFVKRFVIRFILLILVFHMRIVGSMLNLLTPYSCNLAMHNYL